MSKENYEMQFLELMASLTAQTPDTADAPPVKAEPQPEASVEELLGIQVTAITDEGVTEDAVLASPAQEITEEEREDLIWKAITEDVPGLGKTVVEESVSDRLRKRLAR